MSEIVRGFSPHVHEQVLRGVYFLCFVRSVVCVEIISIQFSLFPLQRDFVTEMRGFQRTIHLFVKKKVYELACHKG